MKRNKFIMVFIVLIMLVGIGLVAYPKVSNWVNELSASKVIANYDGTVSNMNNDDIQKMLDEAKSYNQDLLSESNRWKLSPEMKERYYSTLDISGTGMIGVVSIPRLDISIPIYHGDSDSVLQIATGHLEGSSFPIGGLGTHSVISGHTGLPSAELFTGLDEMVVGDEFSVKVLNKTIKYRVDEINIVYPNEMNYLAIDPNKDYVTLLTCTPYGINSHRLLVRGIEVDSIEDENENSIVSSSTNVQEIKTLPTWVQYLILFVSVILVAGIISIIITKVCRRKH